MLSKIELENFNGFQGRTVFPLGKLTLLTGVNRCGKSTFLQTLLLMRQSIQHIHYISADRLEPQGLYEKLCLRQNVETLATQTEQCLNNIFDGAKMEISSYQSNIIELLLNTSNSKDGFKGVNVGFGYHCILPIIISGLIAKEGEMLIVENPEANLHPRAQSRLAQFLAKVSNCGVQVFIETHSDHILNALRIAVLDEIITSDDLSILYFQRHSEQPVVRIPIQPNGGIEEWPEGFFDQIDKDFSRLFGI